MHAHAPSLEKAELVGKGFCSDVYAWGEGRVLKLFHGPVGDLRAQREFSGTQAVHAAGLPVPAAFELIEIGGRCGIVFERVEGVSLLAHTQRRPWAVFDAVRIMAELHAVIHRRTAPTGLPPFRERIADRIDASEAPAEDKQAARKLLAVLPDGTAICHGDLHPENVLLTRRGLVVIDWSSASRGDPFGDVACTSRLMLTAKLPPWKPAYMHLMLACLRPTMHRAYLHRYLSLHGGTRRQIEAWQRTIAVAAKGWSNPAI
jgi:aminoglycoside phosphotransferase (APT) family kinase protein